MDQARLFESLGRLWHGAQAKSLASEVQRGVLALSMDKYGCRVVQKFLASCQQRSIAGIESLLISSYHALSKI